MISLKLIIYLSIGTALMLIPITIQTGWYHITLWKSIPTAVMLTVFGTIGTYILYFVENHWIGGTSFYGAVFFVPVVFPLVAKLLREKYSDLLDLCAPAECIMLTVMKVQCLISGCCGGRELCMPGGQMVQFPSQIAELANALVIFCVLLWLARKGKHRGNLYPWYMVIYGGTRFCLNYLRAANSVFALGLPAGAFWSVWSVLIGTIAIYLWHRRNRTENPQGDVSCSES